MFSKEMQAALEADAAKLQAETGEDHGPIFDTQPEWEASLLRFLGLDGMTPEEFEDYLASK